MAPLSPVKSDPDQTLDEAPEKSARARLNEALGRARAWLKSRPGHVTLVLVFILAGLSGSVSLRQQEASIPSKRIVARIDGELSPKGWGLAVAGMDDYGVRLTLANLPGTAEWLPPRPLGWARYDYDRVPPIITEQPDQDQARILNALLPVSPLGTAPMQPFRLPAAGAERERALLCMTQAVYYESGFEPGEGQQAVAQVVLNRLRHPGYPKSVCGVVYQGSQRTSGCQFSFTCDGSLTRPVSAPAWQRAREVAAQALAGFVYKPVGTATHYHADYVFPYWSVTLVKLRQIGAHIFYRMTGPGGAPAAFVGRYAGGELSLSASVLTGGDARTPDAPPPISLKPAEPITRTITLETGGETRTYTVAAPPEGGTYGLRPAPGGVTIGSQQPPGVLLPSRRQPTSDEIKAINEKMLKFEQEQNGAPATPSGAAP